VTPDTGGNGGCQRREGKSISYNSELETGKLGKRRKVSVGLIATNQMTLNFRGGKGWRSRKTSVEGRCRVKSKRGDKLCEELRPVGESEKFTTSNGG